MSREDIRSAGERGRAGPPPAALENEAQQAAPAHRPLVVRGLGWLVVGLWVAAFGGLLAYELVGNVILKLLR